VTAATAAVRFTVPPLCDEAREAALRVLDSGWLTTGPQCQDFEAELAAYLEVPYAVTVASCTHALELSLRALRLPPGSAVLTPALTFCGAVGAIVHAFTPDPAAVAAAVRRAGPVAAMLCCDLGGYPVDHVALAEAAGLPTGRVVVDAAHGPGGQIGRSTAAEAPFAECLSFYATKNVPIGEGGAVVTHDAEVADWLRSARLHGMTRDAWKRYLPGGSWRYEVAEIGHKANMTDVQAAIGRAQLRQLPRWQARRAEIFARYDAALAGHVGLPLRHPGHALHLYQVRVPRRDAVAEALARCGVATSVHFVPVHQLAGYARELGPAECVAVPVTDRVAEELLSLPLYPGLADDQVDLVAERLLDALKRGSEGLC
jgi:dTDP-4-amino-4,6-dideoxygalactose transaminase